MEILLLLINILIFSGFGKYQVQKDGRYQDLMLTADKWTYDSSNDELPETFVYLRLSGQYLSACITVFLLFSTIFLQLLHLCGISISRITVRLLANWLAVHMHNVVLNMCYSFGAVPFTLFVFGLEMHYSTCPWLDEYFISYSMSDMSSQCAINGWALAGIFSLLSCGLFVSEGIITAFFGNSHATENKETIV
uniref:MARVEL domain-containing protein n=1 Tax=Caenorhabditis tropicalis TaxID=1561998 RepID=A0A1I7TIZ9_9PELO